MPGYRHSGSAITVEINRRLGDVDANFKTLYGKIDLIMEAVNENKGASKQDFMFWTKVGGISGILSAGIGILIKHL